MPQRKPKQKSAKRRPAVRRTVAPPPAPPPSRPEPKAMKVPKVIGSRFRFAGDLARAADVARVLAKYGLAQWLSDVDWEPMRKSLKSEGGESLTAMPFE